MIILEILPIKNNDFEFLKIFEIFEKFWNFVVQHLLLATLPLPRKLTRIIIKFKKFWSYESGQYSLSRFSLYSSNLNYSTFMRSGYVYSSTSYEV